MNVTFKNNYDTFTFSDLWCSNSKIPMIHYDINVRSLFNLIKINLTEKENITRKIIIKKRLFKTIREEVEEVGRTEEAEEDVGDLRRAENV